MYTFSTELWALRTEPLWDSSFHFISLASVTINMLLQKAKMVQVTWYQDPKQTCCSNLDGSVSNTCHTPSTSLQSYFHLFGPSKKHLMVTDSKMLQKFWKLSHSHSIHKAKNAVLKAYIPSKHVVTNT
jgi:hypothetical protein